MRNMSTVLVCFISGFVLMVACSKESSLPSNGKGGNIATGGSMASGGSSGVAGNGVGGDSQGMGGMNSGSGGATVGSGGKVGGAGGSAGGAGGTMICGAIACPLIGNCPFGIVPSTSPCGCPACAPAPDAGTAKDAGAGIACSGDGGFGFPAVARQCTQDSDCAVYVAEKCCGANGALGVAKAQEGTYARCVALPAGGCGQLGCPTYFGYVTDTGKTTPYLGSAIQPMDEVSVTCVAHQCTTDVVLPPDSGSDATTIGDAPSASALTEV